MAPPAGTLRVGRYLLALLAILAVLYAIVFWPGQPHTPKLGLDLRGGAQVVYTARTPDGGTPSKDSMEEARRILQDRVNGQGVAESEVVIQGANQIVISIPGKRADDIQGIGNAAKLNFRPLVMPPVPVGAAAAPSTTVAPSGSVAPSGATSTAPSATPSSTAAGTSRAPQNDAARRLGVPAAAPTTTAPAKATPTKAAPAPATTPKPAAATTTPAPTAKTADPLKGLTFPIPKSEAQYDQLTAAQQAQLKAAMANFDCAAKPPDVDNQTLLACDSSDPAKATLVYLLGPVIVPGTEISSASAIAPSTTGSGSLQWTVSLGLKATGTKDWATYTGAHNTGGVDTTTAITECGAQTTACAKYVAFTLDGVVVSAPYNRDAINGGDTQISGSFTQASATELANELKFGALPLSFKAETTSTVSPTLGDAQLKAGLLAGGIGLALVVIYSLFYYRALGLVTIASLIVSGALTYACLVVLGTQIGFTLTLSGIAGFIVAIGITADSFVVFFERIKDEVHDGRSMRVAVPRAWVRARRTILSADTVSFLAAAVLYYFAAGDVKGFAFTLGLSTVLDLVVVFLFTHPVVSLLSRSRTFGSARFTGLNAVRDGGVVTAEPPAPGARPVRRGRPARAADRSSVAVLERPDVDADAERRSAGGEPDRVDVAEDVAAQPTDRVDDAGATPAAVDPTPATELIEADPASPSRARTTPQAGTAAERAAARRARLREQSPPKGRS